MAEFIEAEDRDGVRMSWNILPVNSTKTESKTSQPLPAELPVPMAIMYTLLRGRLATPAPALAYSPLRCRSCRATLNPFCAADFSFDSKSWACALCLQRNFFPVNYESWSETLAEMHPQCTTVEYRQFQHERPPRVFLFVVDTCVAEDELQTLKASLLQAVALLDSPVESDDAYAPAFVGLVTFGALAYVHELGFRHIPKCHAFRSCGNHVTRRAVSERLGLFSGAAGTDGPDSGVVSRFFVSVSDCQFSLSSAIDELERNPWFAEANQRELRCTGTALSVAAALLGVCFPGVGARIMAFIGGPCTEGVGSIASKVLSEPLRSHRDISNGFVPYFHDAVKFYEALSKHLVNQGHILDLFVCSPDQVGLEEMKCAVERTGGLVVLSESFNNAVFKDSFKHIFEDADNCHQLAFNGIFEVICSRNVKIKGIIGPCTSLEKKNSICSDDIVGQGNTSAWKLCGFDRQTTLCIFFDVKLPEIENPDHYINNQIFFQFLTYYQHANGQMHLRSTTFSRKCIYGPDNIEAVIAGFDQETAAVVMARVAVFKIATEEEFDAVRWLDKSLINICSTFGYFDKNKPSSFCLSEQFALFPKFMYHLRRSQFIQIYNYSPDETAYFTIILNRENVNSSIVMIQPSLLSYSFHAPQTSVFPDASAIAADKILLLDSYFTVVIFHGTTIAEWRNAGFHHKEEHKTFCQLLRIPQDEAARITKNRFPVPRLVICDQHGSQARFLLSKLNPSSSSDADIFQQPAVVEEIYTDDVSFDTFMRHLCQFAVLR